MCIAITKPADTAPDWDAYQHGFNRNPDGWGFAVPHKGRVVIRKDISSFDAFRKEFEPWADRPALVHFRIKTHGPVNKRNCHPFRLTDQLAMIHNGMLDITCSLRADKSDTWHFVKQVLRPMAAGDPRFAWNVGSTFLGEQFIANNKVAFIDADGNVKVWNEEAGTKEADGHWYSNLSYAKPRQPKLSSKPKFGHWGVVSDACASRKYDEISTWEDPWMLDMDKPSYPEDDPIYQTFGSVADYVYDNIQACLAMDIPMELLAEMYYHDPGLLDTLAFYYDVQ